VRLQLILKMVEELGSEILTSPKEIVAFIGNTLDVGEELNGQKTKKVASEKRREGGLGLEDLRIVDEEEETEEIVEREFDVTAGLGVGSGKEELVMTAITLLLAVLEGRFPLCLHHSRFGELIFFVFIQRTRISLSLRLPSYDLSIPDFRPSPTLSKRVQI